MAFHNKTPTEKVFIFVTSLGCAIATVAFLALIFSPALLVLSNVK